MKAYKYNRYAHSWHWSQGCGESYIYLPEAQAIIYEGSGNGKSYKGITKDSKFLNEAKEYIEEIQNDNIKKYISEEQEDFANSYVSDKKYLTETIAAGKRTYIKEIPEFTEGKTTFMPVSLDGIEEIEINITIEDIKLIIEEQTKFEYEKSQFELKQKQFESNISKINNLIIKS